MPLSEPVNSVEGLGIEVRNGCLAFNNSANYLATFNYLSALPYNELEKWCKKYDYTTLKTRYDNEDVNSNKIGDFDDVDTDRILSSILSHLFNERGILIIGDTIIKIEGAYAYSITDGDVSTIEKIENGEDVNSEINVKVYKHTLKLTPEKCLLEGVQLRDSETSAVLWISDNKKRREYVKYITEINVVNDFATLYIELHGRAQNKFTFFWGLAFDDEMVSAQISILGGTYTKSVYPAVYNDFEEFDGDVVENTKVAAISTYMGLRSMEGSISVQNLEVSYTFIKHAGQNSTTTTLTWNGTL
jgi:hypothetical protein